MKYLNRKSFLLNVLAACLLSNSAAFAQEVKIGLTGTFTGPNASLGIPYRNAVEIFPQKLGGVAVKWIVLDDAGDATTAVKNARRFVDEDKVDAIVGSTSTPSAMALFDLANNSKTLQIAMSPVQIPDGKRDWVFNLPQPPLLMVSAIVADMKKRDIKTTAFIGFSDGWGDLNWNSFNKLAADAGIKVLTQERYNRTDPSVMAQVLKVLSTGPEAIFIGGSGTPAVLPHLTLKEQGFKGQIYHTHATIAQAFLSTGGVGVEGSMMPTGPMVVSGDLPDTNPIKKVSIDFITKYQAKWGKGAVPPFAGYAWDGMLVLDMAVAQAVKSTKPGSEAFRTALRDALASGKEVVGTNAVYRYTSTDHYGVDDRARVMVTVKDGAFRLAK